MLSPLHEAPRHDDGLEVRDVTVTYRNGHTALHDASFSLPASTITALVGVNGSGKSTLFKAIMGFVPLAKGEVRMLGMSEEQALERNLVAYVPQSEEVDWNFPVLVEDVVMMGRYGHMNWLRIPKAHDHEMVASALARVGMSEFRKRQIGELSGWPEKAGLPGPRPGAGRQDHPARRTVHRRGCKDRRCHYQIAAGPARRGQHHACLDTQSRVRAAVL